MTEQFDIPEPFDVPERDVLDRAALERLVEDLGPETAGDVADLYLGQLADRLDELQATVTQDPERCRRVAHSLKSASAMLGLTALAELCARLELTPDDAWGRSADLVPAVVAAAGPAADRLRAWRAG